MKALNDIRVQFGIYVAVAVVLGAILSVTGDGPLTYEVKKAHVLFWPLIGWMVAGFGWFVYRMRK